jgi:exodeoxyribonuclease VII small subunit
MAKKTATKKAPAFEDALSDLENLVEAMENDQLPLEDLVAHYEKGAKLLQHCEQVLDAARKRIELIEISPSAENGLESSASPAEDSVASGDLDPEADDNDDIRLL